MRPNEKAIDIFNKMCATVDELLPLDVMDCAKVAVDEMINFEFNANSDAEDRLVGYYQTYWEQVRKELEKL